MNNVKRIIAEVYVGPDDGLHSSLYCRDQDDEPDRAISDTLLDLIYETAPPSDQGLEALVADAKAGCYVARDPSLPDWGVNDKNVWLVPPMAKPGCICISNENTEEYSSEPDGRPQQFTYDQFLVALKHWRDFRELMVREGKANLVGRRYEVVFPE